MCERGPRHNSNVMRNIGARDLLNTIPCRADTTPLFKQLKKQILFSYYGALTCLFKFIETLYLRCIVTTCPTMASPVRSPPSPSERSFYDLSDDEEGEYNT